MQHWKSPESSSEKRNSLGIFCFVDVDILVSIPVAAQREFLTVFAPQLCLYSTSQFAFMLSTRGPLRFENNPSFLRKIPASGGNQKADRCPGIHPESGEIPVRKLDDLCRFVYKINIDFAPFAVAVCLVQVGCGGNFLFPACYRFLFQIHNPEDFIFCQLTDQAVQGGLVGKLPAFFLYRSR